MNLFNLFRWGRNDETASKSNKVAEQRLRLVLAHDRANISPGLLEILKDEIIAVISKHLDINPEAVSVNFNEDSHETRLVADIPLVGRKRA